MSTVILVRHARSVANAENILAGQLPGVRLDPHGLHQSQTLSQSLGQIPIAKVFVSPLERCIATIDPWLARYGAGIPVESDPRIIEPDYGSWSGRKLDELALEPLWKDVQENPELVTFPNGERFLDVWHRVRSFYQALRDSVESEKIYLVISHGDIIKFLIANTLSMEFKSFQSLVVEPASISIAQFSDSQARLIQFNRSHETLAEYLQQLKSAPSRSIKPTLGGEVRAKSGVH